MEKPKLLNQRREKIRTRHYSIRTEKAYIDWTRRYILCHNKRHPIEMGAPEIEKFLIHLSVDRRVASSTQNQVLSAILFLYKEVLDVKLPWLKNVKRARKSEKLPVVFSKEEMSAVAFGQPSVAVDKQIGSFPHYRISLFPRCNRSCRINGLPSLVTFICQHGLHLLTP